MDNIDLGTIDVYSDTAPEYDDGSTGFLDGMFDYASMESERTRDEDDLARSMFAPADDVQTSNRALNEVMNQALYNQREIVTQIDNTKKRSMFDAKTKELEGGKPSENGRYMAYESLEGGTDTIGHGHKLTQAEVSSGKIFGINYKDGITEEEANAVYQRDKERLTTSLGLESASEEIKFLAADVAHRAGNIKNWKFTQALRDGNVSRAYQLLGDFHWTDPSGKKRFYNNRNNEIFKTIGYEPTDEDKQAYDYLQKRVK